MIVRNISQTPLLLRLQVFPEKAEVTASVWGIEILTFEVKVESNILQELTLPAGGISGWEVETKRSIRNGKEIDMNTHGKLIIKLLIFIRLMYQWLQVRNKSKIKKSMAQF